MKVTGERVSTAQGGFNPTWQRHAAAYALSAPFLAAGRVLDLGCGVGHGSRWLGDRLVVGIDKHLAARPSVCGDMRALPLANASVSSVLAVQSIEHVPDGRPVLSEAARVVRDGGTVVLVTPNRFTFGRADEVIDPYHFVEYSAGDLRSLCGKRFADVELLGLFGSPRYLEIFEEERRTLDRALRLDVLRIRRRLPRRAREALYDAMLRVRRRRAARPSISAISMDDFELRSHDIESCLDLVAVCKRPER